MNENQKRIRFTLLFLILMCFVAVFFVSVMGFLNYQNAGIELEESLIAEGETQVVARMEAAIRFGKSLENYFGVEEIFDSFHQQFPGPQPFIITRDGRLLYGMAGEWSHSVTPEAYLASDTFRLALPTLQQENGGSTNARGLRAVFSPILEDGETVGFFGSLFTENIFQESFDALKGRLAVFAVLLTAVLIVAMVLWMNSLRKYRERQKIQFTSRQMKTQGAILMTVGILAISGVSLYIYQADYVSRIHGSVQNSLNYIGQQIERVGDQGVDLREIPDLNDYLQHQLENQKNIRSLNLSEKLFDVQHSGENTNLVSYSFLPKKGSSAPIVLEAEISQNAIQRQIRDILLVLLSSMAILLLFLFEFNTLMDLLILRQEARKEQTVERYERRMGLTLRFTSFLYATAEYMCVPYAAMMIRARGESLFGLSVGMTAALPLTVEGITQILAMVFLPRLVRKWKIRPVLYASAALMIACNVTSFAVSGAMTIIICRALAGIAYAGFKQVANGILVNGYETEAGRSRNIVQENAGIMAGSICGAGLGAILSGSAGYEMTFLISAFLFILYLVLTVLLVPWKQLTERSAEKPARKFGFRNVVRLFRSPEMLLYILVISLPLNIGVMLYMTLIPAVVQTQGVPFMMLSYCYIVNGLAGVYIGPALVSVARKRLGIGPSIALAFGLTAAAVFLLNVPPIMLMILVASLVLGFLDGFTTPLTTDLFLHLKVVRREVDEGSALLISAELSYVLLTFAPIVAEQMLLPGALPIGAMAYAAVAALALVFGLRYRTRKTLKDSNH